MILLDPRLWLAMLITWAAAFGMGYFRGSQSKQAAWDAATAQATRETLAAERKATDFNHVAAVARAASAVVANKDARARAERVNRATEPAAAAAAAPVCRLPDGVRDDLAAAIDAANAAR